MSRPRAAAIAFLAATFVVHAVLAYLYPLLRDDWAALLWKVDHEHRHGLSWVIGFVTSHLRLGDALTYVLANVPILHVVLTPAVFVALLLGITTVALRRFPHFDQWADVGALAGAGALFWIAQPQAGIAVLERGAAANHLYGTAAAVWLAAAYVCAWTPRRAGQVGLVVLALIVGVASRQLAVVATVCAGWYALRGARRQTWMIVAAVALLVGTALGYVDTPRFTIPRRDVDPNLGVIANSIREGGELVSLFLLIGFVKVLLDRYAGGDTTEGLPDPAPAWRWLWIATVIDILALVGPRFTESTLVPASVALCIGGVPYLAWLARNRIIRYLLVVVIAGTFLLTWGFGLAKLSKLHGEYLDRMERLTNATPDEVVTIKPYSQMITQFWFSGEDWGLAANRERIAIDLFHLADIEFATSFYTLEVNPRLEMHLETDLAPEVLAAAAPPRRWAGNIGVARAQFQKLVRAVRRSGKRDFSARILVHLPIAAAAGRPLVVAAYDDGKLVSPRLTRGNADSEGTVRVRPRDGSVLTGELYIVSGSTATSLPPGLPQYELKPPTLERQVLIGCTADRCLVFDSFMPRATAPQ